MRQGYLNLGLNFFGDHPAKKISLCDLPAPHTLDAEATHVYILQFADFLTALPELNTRITSEDWVATKKFVKENLRNASLISKAYTRILLAHYLSIAPKAVPIIRNDLGKPYLAKPYSAYQFNIAHTKTYFALALTRNASIGIDIETIDPHTDYLGISARFFHSDEHKILLNTPTTAQKDVFFRIWTQKEAWVKTIGAGLSFGLQRFSIDPKVPKIINIEDPRYQADDFFSHLLKLQHAHYLCVTSTKKLEPIQLFQLKL